MPDSMRIKEIHQALEAQTYSKYVSTESGEEKPRVANLGYKIDRIAKVLGINVLADGTTYKALEPISVRSVDEDDSTEETEIPAPYRLAHWGYADYEVSKEQLKIGDTYEETDAPLEDSYDGLVYEVMTNKFVIDGATGQPSSILPGGYVCVHNIPQLLRQILDDFDKGLGLQESGAFSLRSAEDVNVNAGSAFGAEYRPKIVTYEGLHSIVSENAMMLSEISRRASGAQVSSFVSQACIYELMSVLGLPVEPKSFNAVTGLETFNGKDITQKIYHPGFSNNAPKIFELWTILMQNIAPLLGSTYNFDQETIETIKEMTPEQLENFIASITQ